MDDAATAVLVTCCLAREIAAGDVVGVGLGTPAGLAAALLAQRVHAPDAVVIVSGAVSPRADVAECVAGAAALRDRAAGFVSHLESMEMAERQAMTVQFLRPAQVDAAANVNVSRVAGEDGRRRVCREASRPRTSPGCSGRTGLYHTDHRARSLPGAGRLPHGLRRRRRRHRRSRPRFARDRSAQCWPSIAAAGRCARSIRVRAPTPTPSPRTRASRSTGADDAPPTLAPTPAGARRPRRRRPSRAARARLPRHASGRRGAARAPPPLTKGRTPCPSCASTTSHCSSTTSTSRWRSGGRSSRSSTPSRPARSSTGRGRRTARRCAGRRSSSPAAPRSSPRARRRGRFLRKILDRRGEIVHHLAFLSSDVDRTVEELRERDFPVLQETARQARHLPVAALELRPDRAGRLAR